MAQTVLVTGATGAVGHEVVKALLEKDINIRVGVRDASKIQREPWIKHVEVVALDYEQPKSLKNALSSVNALFLATPPGYELEKVVAQSVLDQGRKLGLQHIVRLSAIGADEQNLFSHHYMADQLLLSSDIGYTALQSNAFMQNFYNYMPSIKNDHKIIEPAGYGKTSFIDVRDIAEFAAAVLTERGHENKIYELTGAEALDYYQVAGLLSDVLGWKVNYKPLTIQEYIYKKEVAGLSSEAAKRASQYFELLKLGRFACISPSIKRILGREPISLKQFILDHQENFRS